MLGCSRSTQLWIDEVEVNPATVAENPMLGLPVEAVEADLRRRLLARRPFKQVSADLPLPKDARPTALTLFVLFTREASKEGREGTFAELGARLELERREDSPERRRFEVFALGQVKIEGGKRRVAMREALGLALDQLVTSAELQLRALDKPTQKLREELAAEDGRVRAFALEALVARRDPSALQPLLEQLASEDLDEVRRVLGHLVELDDPKAAPQMIELSRGKDPAFLRELLFALGAIGGEEAEAYLFTVAHGHDNSTVRDAAQRALADMSRSATKEEQ